MASKHVLLAAVTLGIALLVHFVGKGFIKQLSILIGVVSGYALASSLQLVDFSIIQKASIVSIPAFSLPKFSFEAIIIIAPVVLAVFMEHVGDITTNGTVVGKNFVENPGLNKTLLGDGLATMIAGFMGGPANTTYGENTGVLAITKNYNPAILRLTAVFAIILGLVGKLGAVLTSIPTAVMGGISLMLFTMISLIGVKNIRDNKVQMTPANLIVMASILIIGLAPSYLKALPLALPIPGTSVTLSGLSLAAIVGVILNTLFTTLKKQHS